MRILVYGLPGSGKSVFSSNLKNALDKYEHLAVSYINADDIRKHYDDWDFSIEGRERQLQRMVSQANSAEALGFNVVILDFVCPLERFRDEVNADINVWMNTITESRYQDTNKIFEEPMKGYCYTVKTWPESYATLTKVIGEVLEEA